MTNHISDEKIAMAMAQLHANDAPLEATLVDVVIAFLKLNQIRAADVHNFRMAVIAVVDELNEYRGQQGGSDK
jgi:hypothetical protein